MTATAGKTEQKAEAELNVMRDADFAEATAQKRVAALLGTPDDLPKGAAWEILQNPPSALDQFTRDTVQARLGGRNGRDFA